MPRGSKPTGGISDYWFTAPTDGWQEKIDFYVLRDAIMGAVGMNEKASREIAFYVLDSLKEDGTVVDNTLDGDEKSVFYMLEDYKLMSSMRNEIYLLKGKLWRCHQWYPNIPNIVSFAEQQRQPKVSKEKEEDHGKIYSDGRTLSDDIWKEHARQEICLQPEDPLLTSGPKNNYGDNSWD